MAYTAGAVERVMKVQEVILRALGGQLTRLQAADILGRRPRSIRRLRLMYQRYGDDGLLDRRRQTPSPKRARGGGRAPAPALSRPLSRLQRPAAVSRRRASAASALTITTESYSVSRKPGAIHYVEILP
jgi:hypothetical protein